MGIIYIPIHKLRKDNMTTVNTTAEQFKLITDKKDEPDYKAVSKFVGGMVECVTFPNGDLLLLNEEGKLMQLPLNPEATALWRATFTKDKYAFGHDDFVVGPAILIKKDALNTCLLYTSPSPRDGLLSRMPSSA